jgi:hypothetical protein
VAGMLALGALLFALGMVKRIFLIVIFPLSAYEMKEFCEITTYYV